MIIIGSVLKLPKSLPSLSSLLTPITHSYHIEDLLKRNYSEHTLQFYTPANHLYISNTIHSSFSERKLIRILLEQVRMQENMENYKRLLEHAARNLGKIQDLNSIVMLMTVGFEIRWKDQGMWERVARRGFELLALQKEKNQIKAFSYTVCKMMIAINCLTGLHKFSDTQFSLFPIRKFKPLFLTYILQLFWQNNLQYSYKFPSQVIELLSQNRQLIPFSDVHHMIMARKIIRDPVFGEITEGLQRRLKRTGDGQGEGKGEARGEGVKGEQVKQRKDGEGLGQGIERDIVKVMHREYIRDLEIKYL